MSETDFLHNLCRADPLDADVRVLAGGKLIGTAKAGGDLHEQLLAITGLPEDVCMRIACAGAYHDGVVYRLERAARAAPNTTPDARRSDHP